MLCKENHNRRHKGDNPRLALRGIIKARFSAEVRLQRALARFYGQLGVDLAKGFTEAGELGVEQQIARSTFRLEDLLIEENNKTGVALGKLQFESILGLKHAGGLRRKQDIAIELQNEVEEFNRTNAVKSAAFITQTEKAVATKIIADAIKEGLGEQAIALQLKRRFKGITGKFRAATIARTETGIIASKAQDDGARATGVVESKTWAAVDDTRTRAHHNNVDNETVEMNGLFQVGNDKMRYPQDPNASLGNIINCRCVLLYNP